MKKMVFGKSTRRVAAAVLAVVMVLSLAGCSKKEETVEETVPETTEEEYEMTLKLSANQTDVTIPYGGSIILIDAAEDEEEAIPETEEEEIDTEDEAEETAETDAAADAEETEEAEDARDIEPVVITVTLENGTDWEFSVSAPDDDPDDIYNDPFYVDEDAETEEADVETEETEESEKIVDDADETEEAEEAEEDDADETEAVNAYDIDLTDGEWTVTFYVPGYYVISLTAEMGRETVGTTAHVTVVDDVAPELTVPDEIEITVGDDYDFAEGVSAWDEIDGDLTDMIVIDADDAVLDETGETTVHYAVSDSSGNTAETDVVVVVNEKVEETKAAASETANNTASGNTSSGTVENSGTSNSGSDTASNSASNSGSPTVESSARQYQGYIDLFNLNDLVVWNMLWNNMQNDMKAVLTDDDYNALYAYVMAGIDEYNSSQNSGSSSGNDTTVETPAETEPESTQATVQEPYYSDSMAKEAFDIMNRYRAEAGVSALNWNDTLYEAAKVRAQECTINLSHTRPDGTKCYTVFTQFGIGTVIDSDPEMVYGATENIAAGQKTASSVMESWYNSDGHRYNMLYSDLTDAAIACYYYNGTYYWVTLFWNSNL